MKRWLLLIGAIVVGLLAMLGYNHLRARVTRIELPKGELRWSTTRPEGARMCVPAAFTGIKGEVVGSYRIDGKTTNPNNRSMKVSLKGDMFYLSRNWLGDNGFHQYALVYNSKAMQFRDTDKSMRRALCKDEDGVFILESNYPMTLTTFAYYCSKRCTNAAYLDMGEYGYGYIKLGWFTRPLYIWAIFTQHKQTNWLYIE